MGILDLFIILGYLAAITAFGVWFARRQKTTEDYFVGGRNVPWWAVSASIVATETSTITFISVPGIVFAKNGNFEFLQVVFGYLLGRLVISLIFIPLYFKGELQTVYQLLGHRFGNKVKMLASSLFVVMRNLADGIRLLLTAIVLAAVYTAFVPDARPDLVIVASIIVLGAVMIVFTYYGGMEAVIWVEVVQLGIYIAGAVAAAFVIAGSVDGGLSQVAAVGRQFDKFSVFDFGFDLTKTFTFWAGIVGGCFLTMSTHGTDQYLVQRYLCTDRPSRAVAALLTSGVVILGQFVGFLFIGVLLFAFYAPYEAASYAQAGVAGSGVPVTAPFAMGDQVFPDFITKHMPSGLSGLVVAAIFAAALSSSLNSIAATTVNDLYRPFRPGASDRSVLRLSHWLTLLFGVIQIAVALLLIDQRRSALDQALSIASLINGPVLGVFLVGVFLPKVRENAALLAMLFSCLLMIYVRFFTPLAWTWYVLVGAGVTFLSAYIFGLLAGSKGSDPGDRME
ncbi:MAG: sodium:solute symporter [Acidobacteria bacterium]|nr:MAG: sodium:solute symporter [Acidobacteriota bacterium]REK01156.1 MAG: sodium:solute symporter [Acidobacteriota bacterium]REK14112.1 MAG: sodium:solute symporter [Acidobacteriota bacterium]REK44827.1 MAG: sodium:solute symporter [Acidobacteriota bacterium]